MTDQFPERPGAGRGRPRKVDVHALRVAVVLAYVDRGRPWPTIAALARDVAERLEDRPSPRTLARDYLRSMALAAELELALGRHPRNFPRVSRGVSREFPAIEAVDASPQVEPVLELELAALAADSFLSTLLALLYSRPTPRDYRHIGEPNWFGRHCSVCDEWVPSEAGGYLKPFDQFLGAPVLCAFCCVLAEAELAAEAARTRKAPRPKKSAAKDAGRKKNTRPNNRGDMNR